MSTPQILPAISISTLKGFNPQLVTDGAGLDKVKSLISRVAGAAQPIVGFDTETNIVNDFYFRRIRSIQIGDANEQFLIDLLPFAGSTDALLSSQGLDGKNSALFAPIKEVLAPVLCTSQFLKVGVNLGFEYEVMRWNLGMRIWNLFSTDMVERAIQAGRHSLKDYPYFSMAAMAARYFEKTVDKTAQKSFDMETPLTEEQVIYGCLDTFLPLALRQKQLKVIKPEKLEAVSQIENDAIPSYIDMHINGQRINRDRWMERINKAKARFAETVEELDTYFIPVVGDKNTAIDTAKLDYLERIWKTQFEEATPEELELAVAKRKQKDPIRKLEIHTQLSLLTAARREQKAAARAEYMELSKKRTKAKALIEKCAGNALINYNSGDQLLAAFQRMPGCKKIKGTDADTLLLYNDIPAVQALRRFAKLKKEITTYGEMWTKEWVTHPCKEEGWLHPGDGRLHCVYNQLEAETGRSSSAKPNAQNLPKDDEVRACFCADDPDDEEPEGYCIVTVDMAGAELRIIAELANDPVWIEAFNKGKDVHSVGTELLYPNEWPAATQPGCAYYMFNECGEQACQKCKCPGHIKLRDSNKATNFLLAYGGGPSALADAIGSTVEVAKKLMELHSKTFPSIWGYLKISGEAARFSKQARDMFGRRRVFPDPTWDGAKEFYIQEHPDKLEYSEEVCEEQILNFKKRELREPTDDEEYRLTHRDPNSKEISSMYKGMFASIERRGKNHCIQGTNASIIKRAMGCGFDKDGIPYLWHLLAQFKAKLLSMVHDELVLQCPKRFGQQLLECVGNAFRRAGAEVLTKVTMEYDGHVSDRWQK